uniref:protein-serine/threonine phosphatase n=1 Tax=Oryza punctata TaxID=4537 RepID=A0A0E0K3Q5_ORYPU
MNEFCDLPEKVKHYQRKLFEVHFPLLKKFLKPMIAAVGSCCLVGIIWRGVLYVANLGDSRAVVGYLDRTNKITAEQITRDHNACMEEVRQELISRHPDDSQIVVLKHGVWRIKGIIQVSRTIGDAYLKRREFALDPSITRFRLSEPLRQPVLTAEPSICTRALSLQDQFVIFASDGLWEHLTNQQVVAIVYKNPRAGIAKRLVNTALKEAARKREMRFVDLKKVEKGCGAFSMTTLQSSLFTSTMSYLRRKMFLFLNFQSVGLSTQQVPRDFRDSMPFHDTNHLATSQ